MLHNEIVSRIARQIRAVRLKKKLTIQQLAHRTNVSKGLLSKIENSRTIPSLPVFVQILESLGISLKDFFDDLSTGERKAYWLIPKSRYIRTELEGSQGVDYRHIISQNLPASTADIYFARIGPGKNGNPAIMDGCEFQHVITGTLEYRISNDRIKVEEGDSILFDASRPHLAVNISEKEAVMLVVHFISKKE